MADTQPQSAPAVTAGNDIPAIDNTDFARQGARLKDEQQLEAWQRDNANSIGGLTSTVVRAATDSGTTGWDFIGRQFDSERRRLNAKHKASGFDYWQDPRRKDWEAGLSNDELSMVHGVASNGYIDVILALDRVKQGRDMQEHMALQNGVVSTTGALIGGMTDPVGLLAGMGVGSAIKGVSGLRSMSRAATAAKATLARPGVGGALLRIGAEGAEQAVGSLLADNAMNVIGEYRSKDDMEMNAISSLLLGAGIKTLGEGVGALRNRSGGKTRQAVADAADDSLQRMADTAEKPVDLGTTPEQHAREMVAEVADDAVDAGRSGRRTQIFNDAEQARLREEFDGVAPREVEPAKLAEPPKPGEEVHVTPAEKVEAKELQPHEVDFNQFDASAWKQPAVEHIPVGEAREVPLPDIDQSALDKGFLDRIVGANAGDPDAIVRQVTALTEAGLIPSDAGQAYAKTVLQIADEMKADLVRNGAETLAGHREPRLFLDDGEEVVIRADGRTHFDTEASKDHPAFEAPTKLREVSHREALQTLSDHLNEVGTTPENHTLKAAADWLLKIGDQNLLDNGKTFLDFKGSRGEAFTEGHTLVGVKTGTGAHLRGWQDRPLRELVGAMGNWSQTTIVHEIVHNMTTRAIRVLEEADLTGDIGKFSQEIRLAWDTLKGYREDLASFSGAKLGTETLVATEADTLRDHHYAARNMLEFVAQAMSDYKTQLVLSSMKPRGTFRYFANALEHVFTSLKTVLMDLGGNGAKVAGKNRTGFTEAAEAIEVLLKANTRDRVKIRVLTEEQAQRRIAAQAEATGPFTPADPATTDWAAGATRATEPAPKDDAHVKFMSGGLFPDARSAVKASPGVGGAPDFDANLPRSGRALAVASELAAKHLPEGRVILSDRMSSPASAQTGETLSVGNTHIIGIPKGAVGEVADAAVVRGLTHGILAKASPAEAAGLRSALTAHVQEAAGRVEAYRVGAPGDNMPAVEAFTGGDAAEVVTKARALFADAVRTGALPKDAHFTDLLEDVLREAEGAPAAREAAAVQSVTPYKVTGSVGRLRQALEAQADAFFAKAQLSVARTAVAAGRFTSFVSDGLVMARSQNKVVRMLSAVVAETTTGGVATRQTTAAVRKTMLRSKLIGADLFAYNNAYQAYRPGGPRQVYDDVFVGDTRREFDRGVTLEILRRGSATAGNTNPATINPHITRAADAIEAIADRARQEQLTANTLGSGGLGETSVGYLPQRLDGQKLLAATETQRTLLRDHLAEHWAAVYQNWDPKFAKDFADYYVERAVRRARGAAADMVQAEQSGTGMIREALEDMGNDPNVDQAARDKIAESVRGLGHTKGKLDVDMTASLTDDGMRVLDFYVTEPQRLMQSYVDRVSGDIALTEVGILGRSGREQLSRVLETSANVTQQELAAVKRVMSEIAGEPTQGFRNKQLANLRILTGLARLGGLAWNQLAETMNATHMLGLDATLKGLPRLPAMIGEVRRIVNGQKVDNPWLDSFKDIVGEYGTEGHYLHFPTDPPDARLADYADQNGVVERLLRGGSHLQAKLSLFRAVHGAQHRWVAEQIVKKAAVYLTDAAAGDAKPNRWLKDMGFTDEMLAASKAHIAKAVQFDASGTITGFDLAKLGTHELQADFASSVHRGVAQIIQGTFAGERAAWMHSDLGLLLGQFRSFTATGLEKQWARTRYVVGEDTHVAAAYGYMAGLVLVQASLGAVLHSARVGLTSLGQTGDKRQEYLANRLSPWELARASMNYSSLSGGTGEIMDILGGIGGTFFEETMQELGKHQKSSQTPGRGGGGDVLGAVPALDYVRDVGAAGSSAMDAAAKALDPDREVDKLGKTLREASRLLPGSSLPPLTILLDQLRRLDEAGDE